ncbi:MAG: dienelactone hydrolase family protein [Fermentimonas sp.]|nr:dienelactone hydrolase family protein [Fermentimonas sp.]
MEPLFTPPKEYENTLHGYRSPLQFNDGTPVKDNNDWTERRNEIRETWLSITDEWPPILEDQQFEIIDQEKREDFTQYTVRFKWTQNDYTEGYLFIPDKKGKMPAVITVGDKENRDFANQLTKRGFVTLSFGTIETTGTTENKTAEVRHLSSLAYSAANAYEALAKVDVVDPKRIGIVGHSYGGKWAMFASSLYDKFATAVWIDSGIHELHALMAPRPFLVSGGSTDPAEQWIPLNHTIAVNNLLEYKHRVAVSKGSNETVYSFLEWFLEY